LGSCNSPWKLSNIVSHSTCWRQIRVDCRLLMVESQIASLTPGPSSAHNLGWRCPNGSCEAILDIYISRPFQRYKEYANARCFDRCNQALTFRESRRTPSSHFWECEFHPHTYPKVGLRQYPWTSGGSSSLLKTTSPSMTNGHERVMSLGAPHFCHMW
jgi:hypothetical protein